ncbi:MAG: inositol monophosphatase family protein, partial [Planctomycetota bacterium]
MLSDPQRLPGQPDLELAIVAARAGAVELMQRIETRTVSEKNPKDLVTDADLAAQQAIFSMLREACPNDALVGEEEGHTCPPESVAGNADDAPACWVVDPLDGTVNFVHRLRGFAVSIGLWARGKMRIGVIYDPCADEIFTALDGAGAACNGVAMHSSRETQIDASMICCSFPAGVRRDAVEVQQFVNVLEASRSVRRLGSCALNLCYVADGRLDGYWATSVKAWDCGAGFVIAREAGAAL